MNKPSNHRREPRINVSLDVTLQTVDGDRRFKTKDASAQGVFIVCPEPLPLRKLVRFRTQLSDGEELQMLGMVAHTVNRVDAAEMGRTPGMGLQLYSVGRETRERWHAFVESLYDREPSIRDMFTSQNIPRVRVRIPNSQLLERFYKTDYPSGGIFLRTAEIHPEGTAVLSEIIHPETGKVFSIPAQVQQVIETPIRERGMRLAFEAMEDTEPLRTFIYGES